MSGPADIIMQVYGAEWVIVIIILVLVFFGVKKIPQLARSFGKASSEFEKARFLAKREIEQLKNQNGTLTNVDREKLESIADRLGIDYYGKTDEQLRAEIDSELNRTTKK